jgi:zona occludens toxin (predicted ATPase)
MIGTVPTKSALPVSGSMAIWSQPWSQWFLQVFLAVFGWKKSYYATLTHDFGSISAQVEATQTVTVAGARSGDMVLVRPTTAVNGIITDGTVTAVDTVTVRAVNYSAGAIDPGSQVYRVLVWQQ